MPKLVRYWRVLFLFLAACASLNAQDTRGRVQGLVTDSSRAAVPGATVTLTNVNTQVTTTKSTTEAGLYRFDAIDPGTYTLTVELTGFKKFSQERFEIQARADVTINAILSVGELTEVVTVEGNAVQLAFNTTDAAVTIDYKLTSELPRFDRNPFKLTLLMPNATETRKGEQNPYNTYSANSVELGGGTNLKNNLLVDGSPVGIGYKVAWVPNADAVQEANVDKSSVDASSGHSAGGTLSMATKSGTNEFHGGLFWLGRQPNFNAVSDRTTGQQSAAKNNIFGASVGHPILKNRLFNFFSYEAQKPREPWVMPSSVPTALEKQGDFSQSKNVLGQMLTIYDPYTTTFDPSTGKVTRQAFSGNKVPSSRWDALGALWMSQMLSPNRTPDDITGTNNFISTTSNVTNYYDISDRVDWNVNKSLRIFARPSLYRTNIMGHSAVLEASPLYIPGGSKRNGFTTAAEAMWTISPSTVVAFRGDFRSFVDEFHSTPEVEKQDPIAKYWPNNNWFAPYKYDPSVFPTYLPSLIFTGKSGMFFMGRGGWNVWSQRPNGWSFSAQMSQMRNQHYLKTGFEFRRTGGHLIAVAGNQFTFDPSVTADTFQNPNTALVGSSYATLLLGAISDTSQAVAAPLNENRSENYAAYIQDDWKVNRRITLNLGLRWELDTPWHDPYHMESIGPDFTVPTPGVSQNPPNVPSSVTSMLNVPYSWTGSWRFTSDAHPGSWETQRLVLMPRAGIAVRVNDVTALRFGYARYVVSSDYNYTGPPYGSFEAVNLMQPMYPGYDKQQSALPLANGIPQAVVSNPFPTGVNPLVAPGGRSQGAVIGLGYPNIGWQGADYSRPVNDRFNISISRQLPQKLVAEVAFFANMAHNLSYAYNLNQVDPRAIYKYKAATAVTVANPFYNYLTADQFPGSLRNLKTVPLNSLLVQRPQYGNMWEAFKPGAKEQYYSLDFRVQRPFSNGYNFMFGYSYIREKTQVLGTSAGGAPQINGVGAYFLDDLDNYMNNLTYLDSPNPHHRGTIAGSYQFPFGQGRKYLASAPRAADMILGGWQIVASWYGNSGNYLRMPAAQIVGDPTAAPSDPSLKFNTAAFQVLPSYTPRTNPDHYDSIRGYMYWEMQATLSKNFKITEKARFELKASAYNLTNRLNRADPDVSAVTSPTFGRALRQGNSSGRQIEFGARITF
jgi:hypothetical protein